MIGSKRILVVDDERDVVTHLCATLKDNGYDTVEAFDGEMAIEKAVQLKPDLITLDVCMPEMSGVKAYRRLKEAEGLCDIPVIIITGISQNFRGFISTRTQVPAPEGYIEKPVIPEKLLAEVKRLIG